MSSDRIRIDMSARDIVMALCDGNPGALNVLLALATKGGPIGNIDLLVLDSLRIYGPRIWMLFKDVCRQDLPCMQAVLAAVRRGEVSRETLNAAIDNYGAGLDLAPYVSAAEASR